MREQGRQMSYLRPLQQITLVSMTYEQQKLISHLSEAGESEMRVPAPLGPRQNHKLRGADFSLPSRGRKQRGVSRVLWGLLLFFSCLVKP